MGRVVLVGIWLVGAASWAAVYIQRHPEPAPVPPMEFIEGQPVAYLITGEMPAADVLNRVKATSPGNPVGRGDRKVLKTFKYVYRDVAPGSVRNEQELADIAAAIVAQVDPNHLGHGRPFVLIQNSESGWLFTEKLRVGVPVEDSVKAPAELAEATFAGAMVAVQAGKTIGERGEIGEMERWAEDALRAVTGTDPDFSGPFILRFVDPGQVLDGPLTWDWVVPVGSLPASPSAIQDASAVPAAAAAAPAGVD